MHLYRKKRNVISVIITSVLTLLLFGLPAVALFYIGWGLVEFHVEKIMTGVWVMGVWCGNALLHWIFASQSRCPLCRVPVMGGAGCQKHRRAKTILKSHRLATACSVLLRRRYVCPFCNEITRVSTKRDDTASGSRTPTKRRR
jgi:hypothetical protein